MMINQLKANLFDTITLTEDYNIDEMQQTMMSAFQAALRLDEIELYVLDHKAKSENELVRFALTMGSGAKFTKQSSVEELFTENSLITILEDSHSLLMKIRDSYQICCYLFMHFPKKITWQNDELEEIRQIIERTNMIFQNKIFSDLMKRRQKLIIKLTSRLHSLQRTDEVLTKTYRILRLLYPDFKLEFLMSQEQKDINIPIAMLRYADEDANSAGTIAFINNEVQIHRIKEENLTKVYSPLFGQQSVYGVLKIDIPSLNYLREDDLDFIREISNLIGRAIERTTLNQSTNQTVVNLQLINEASRELNENLDAEQITLSVIKHIKASCNAEEVGVIFFGKDIHDFESLTISNASTPHFKTEPGQRLVKFVAQYLVRDPLPHLSGNFTLEFSNTQFNSVMLLPMMSSNKMIGTIIITHLTPYYFSFERFKYLQSFVQHASLAYVNSLLKAQLKKSAITDHLTKIYSRSYLDKIISDDMNENNCGALILFDVDDFKQINDTYGHFIGDKVLIQVAATLKETIADDGVVARWGGEEFAAYLPSCHIEFAQEKAELARLHVAQVTEPHVTLSCGVSVWDVQSLEPDTIDNFFIRADEALYDAKLTGKNKVVVQL